MNLCLFVTGSRTQFVRGLMRPAAQEKSRQSRWCLGLCAHISGDGKDSYIKASYRDRFVTVILTQQIKMWLYYCWQQKNVTIRNTLCSLCHQKSLQDCRGAEDVDRVASWEFTVKPHPLAVNIYLMWLRQENLDQMMDLKMLPGRFSSYTCVWLHVHYCWSNWDYLNYF